MMTKVKNISIELKSFFSECIDPNYSELVNKLNELYSKLMKLRCEMSDEDVKVMQEITNAKDDSDCKEEVQYHLSKCYFSEPEMMQISKNVSSAANFTLDLINGNDQQCGVANRIEKCFLKSMRICEGNTLSKQTEYYFNSMMKSVNCNVDETVDIAESTISEPLRIGDLSDTFKNATRNCKFEELQDLLKMGSEIKLMLHFDKQYLKNNLNIMCELEKKDEYKSIITKSSLTLAKCVDPNYVKHVQKLEIVALRSVDVFCNSIDVLISMVNDTMEESDCVFESVFQIIGCVFSQAEVRDVMDDRSLISNFTMDLLDGTEKKCGIINEIQLCFGETLQKCDGQFMSKFIKLFSDLFLESTNCKRHEMSSGWKNTQNERTLYKEFIFQDFNEAFGFMTRVALHAAELKYYPEFNNVNNRVKIIVTSDDSANGLKLAKIIDEITIYEKQ